MRTRWGAPAGCCLLSFSSPPLSSPLPLAPQRRLAAAAAAAPPTRACPSRNPSPNPPRLPPSLDRQDFYVYLPPGSSMRDPLPSSLSDPLDNRRVYYRDPPKRK